jgi:hypothetical protein
LALRLRRGERFFESEVSSPKPLHPDNFSAETSPLMSPPRCRTCSKPLSWELPRFRCRRAKDFRKQVRQARASEARLAIRCTYCLQVFCLKCVKRHFAPIQRAQRAVDRKLAEAASLALDVVLKGRKR